MRLYLDDDTASALLAKLLRNDGNDLQLPSDAAMSGKPDPVHLTHAIGEDRVCLTKNYEDYLLLHNLIRRAQGHHSGIIVVRQDNDPTRDLTARGIVPQRGLQARLCGGAVVLCEVDEGQVVVDCRRVGAVGRRSKCHCFGVVAGRHYFSVFPEP